MSDTTTATTEVVGCAPRSLDAGTLYKWNDWLLVRTDDSIIVWCDACALELRWVNRAHARHTFVAVMLVTAGYGSSLTASCND